MNRNQTNKNNEDFDNYYNLTISINKYIERLLDSLSQLKGMNKSQCIRNLIYEDYQRNKYNIQELKNHPKH